MIDLPSAPPQALLQIHVGILQGLIALFELPQTGLERFNVLFLAVAGRSLSHAVLGASTLRLAACQYLLSCSTNANCAPMSPHTEVSDGAFCRRLTPLLDPLKSSGEPGCAAWLGFGYNSG